MKVQLKNIGLIKDVEYEIGDLTIICGQNNTGKNYAMYALYGFLQFLFQEIYIEDDVFCLNEVIDLLISSNNITELHTNNQTVLPIHIFSFDVFNKILELASKYYTETKLQYALGIQQKSLKNTKFQLSISDQTLYNSILLNMKNAIIGDSESKHFTMQAYYDGHENHIVIKPIDNHSLESQTSWRELSIEEKNLEMLQLYKDCIESIFLELLLFFGELFCGEDCVQFFGLDILTAERSGVSMFNSDLNLGKGKFIQELVKNTKINLDDVVRKIYNDSTYALPVKDEIAFFPSMINYKQIESFIVTDYPEIIEFFQSISGGNYQTDDFSSVSYSPQNTRKSLSLGESASAVRALSHLNFYLLHKAVKGGLLMIDEPELNLHPHNQRKMAGLIAMLVNVGIKVMVTTHSNFFINELNSLMMLYNNDNDFTKKIMKQYNYPELSMLSATKVKAYIAHQSNQTVAFNPVIITEYGMQDTGFYDDINEINTIQSRIIQGF
jgi:predicted ATP-dependent endonuclease of OLD family